MRKLVTIVSGIALCAGLSAQNINQSVQVTNDYVNRFADIQKGEVKLAIPDTLYRFDYNFDYSVFDSPYRGSYDFSPYRIQVTPEKMAYDGSKLYLRAGAGYSLHPLLNVIYNPIVRSDFALSVFTTGGGYYGKYYNGAGAYGGTQQRYDGYNMNESAGVVGHKLFTKNLLRFKAGYDGIYAAKYTALSSGNQYVGSGYHSGYASADLSSSNGRSNYFDYDLGLDYRFGSDVMTQDAGSLNEHDITLRGYVGPVINQNFGMLIDFSFGMDMISAGGVSSNMNLADIAPHFQFSLGPVDIDAGARLDYLSAGGDTNFTVAPVLRADYRLFDDILDIFAGATGGQRMLGLNALKPVNPFYTVNAPALNSMTEKYNLFAGVGGNWGSRLQYELKGGYASYDSMPLTSLGGFDFVDMGKAYADLDVNWKSERLEVGTEVHFGYTALSDDSYAVYKPSMFSGEARAIYNWSKRIYAGLWLEGASARDFSNGAYSAIPGYVNVGLEGEYKINTMLGAWLQAGNLAGMAIEKIPGVVEKSPYITVGVTLKIQ